MAGFGRWYFSDLKYRFHDEDRGKTVAEIMTETKIDPAAIAMQKLPVAVIGRCRCG